MIFSPLALVIVLLPLMSLSMNDTLQNSSNFCLWLAISDTALLFERGIFITSLDASKVIGLRNIARAQKLNGLRNPGIARQSKDSYFAQRNPRIAQIPGSRGTYTSVRKYILSMIEQINFHFSRWSLESTESDLPNIHMLLD